MVSSDRTKTLVLAASPAVLLGLLLLWQARSTGCAFRPSAPGSSLFLCRQRLLALDLQPALVRVSATEGWLWGRRQVRIACCSAACAPAVHMTEMLWVLTIPQAVLCVVPSATQALLCSSCLPPCCCR